MTPQRPIAHRPSSQASQNEIEQLAITRCDPPLHVTTRVIPSGANSRRGYVIVDIPASPLAPHMVDGRYWGRGEHTKRQLTDAEVERLLRRRDDLDRSSEMELDAYIARDPYTLPDRPRRLGHQFLVGVPLQASNTMLLDAITGDDWVWVTARYQVGPGTGGWHPSPHQLTQRDRRDDGWAATSHNLTTGRTLTEDAVESALFEIEVTEAGAVRLYSGRVTDFGSIQANGAEEHLLFDVAVAGNTRHFVHMLDAVANETRYRGLWALGLALIGVSSAMPYSIAQNWPLYDPPRRSDDTYHEFARASTAELAAAPGTVTSRLVGRFLRSVRVADHPKVAPYLEDPSE